MPLDAKRPTPAPVDAAALLCGELREINWEDWTSICHEIEWRGVETPSVRDRITELAQKIARRMERVATATANPASAPDRSSAHTLRRVRVDQTTANRSENSPARIEIWPPGPNAMSADRIALTIETLFERMVVRVLNCTVSISVARARLLADVWGCDIEPDTCAGRHPKDGDLLRYRLKGEWGIEASRDGGLIGNVWPS
jgi:hypothetical protein